MTERLRTPLVLLVVIGLAVAAVMLVSEPEDDVGPSATVDTGETADAGVWYCPAPTGQPVSSDVVAVSPPLDRRPARLDSRVVGGPVEGAALDQVFPGAGVGLPAGSDASLEVRWVERPVAVSRITRYEEAPAGMTASNCIPFVSRDWYLPGVTTASGSTAQLHVTNPFSQDAAIAIEGLTPQGPETPIVLQNLPVDAGETLVVDLNEYLPQQPDLGIVLRARTGRVTVEATQQSVPTVNGVNGRSAVTTMPELDTEWYVPWVATGGRTDGGGPGLAPPDPAATPAATEEATGTEEPTEQSVEDILDVEVEGEAEPSSWLWVTNPGETTAELELAFLTAEGRIDAEALGTIEVGPSTTRRLVLDDVLPDVAGDIGVEITSDNDVPFVASMGTIVAGGDGAERTGIAITRATALPDSLWSLTAPSDPGRHQWVTLTNVDTDPAVVDLALWTGASTRRPGDLQGIEVPGGATVTIDLTEHGTDSGELTVFGLARQGRVTMALRGLSPTGILDFAATTGVPYRIWEAIDVLGSVQREDGLVNRLGTDLGLPVAPSPTESPTPVPSPTPLPEEPDATPSPAPGSGRTPTPSGATTPAPSPDAGPTTAPSSPTPSPAG